MSNFQIKEDSSTEQVQIKERKDSLVQVDKDLVTMGNAQIFSQAIHVSRYSTFSIFFIESPQERTLTSETNDI